LGIVGILILSLIQLFFFAALIFVWTKMKRSLDDDTKWSRGLQLLQSKIAVIEDLSDRTEEQVRQLTIMMEDKVADLQRKIDEADDVLNKISRSMKKSIEVAQIFQDKIPHEEIIERQNTVKFVKAALMANEGREADEIAEVVDLPKSQIEFIVKVNSDRLSFDTSQMPEWLKAELNKDPMTKSSLFEKKKLNASVGLKMRSPLRPLEQILKQKPMSFEVDDADIETSDEESGFDAFIENKKTEAFNVAPVVVGPNNKIPVIQTQAAEQQANQLAQGALGKKAKDMGIRPVVFPRIEMPR
jgi:hypothetical protein